MSTFIDYSPQYVFRLRLQNSNVYDFLTFENPLKLDHKFFFKIKKNLDSKNLELVNEWTKNRINIGQLFYDGECIIITKYEDFTLYVTRPAGGFREYKQKFTFQEQQVRRVKLIFDQFQINFDIFQVIKVQKQSVTPLRPNQNFAFDHCFNERLALYHNLMNKQNFRSFLREGKTFENKIFQTEPFNRGEFQEILEENNKQETKKRQNLSKSIQDQTFIDANLLKRQKQPIEDFLQKNNQSDNQRKSKSVLEDDIQCCICIQNFSNMKAQSKNCKHEYCFDCVMEWLKVQNTCPLCKTEITKIIKMKNNQQIEVISIEQKVMQLEDEVDEELENADSYCYKCRREDNQNVLLVCDLCVTKCCHIFCLDPPLEFIPETDWFCDFCVVQRGVETVQPIANIFAGRNRQARRHRTRQNEYSLHPQHENNRVDIIDRTNYQRDHNNSMRQINSIALRRTANSKKKLEEEIENYMKLTDVPQNSRNNIQIRENQNYIDDELTKFIESLNTKL